ncbi:TadE family protein [Georgenia sp. H159]|uniref:TadE/TadG family type IV pilus assembly protein n=1 Tax=Georgenia sp. H159 TaxID=3076115 RepID=UPI002D7A2883|nr:TadE family protein [Georgenia sp. H159]
MTGRSARRAPRDRGAAAVEFAIVLPVLVALVLGIIAYGHAFHVQSVLSNAARDAVRVVALHQGADSAASAREAAVAAASPSITLDDSQIAITPSTCAGGTGPRSATVTITYPMELLGGIGDITLTGRGTMRCNG